MMDYKESFYFAYDAFEDGNLKTSRSLTFENNDGADLYEIQRVFKCFLHACGFAQKSIDEVFGEDKYGDFE